MDRWFVLRIVAIVVLLQPTEALVDATGDYWWYLVTLGGAMALMFGCFGDEDRQR